MARPSTSPPPDRRARPAAAPGETPKPGRVTAGESITVTPLTNDTDPDGDSLSISSIDGQPVAVGSVVSVAGGKAQVRINPDGSVTVTTTPDATDPIVFAYSISDGALTSSSTVTITVTAPRPTATTTTDTTPAPAPAPAPTTKTTPPTLGVSIRSSRSSVSAGQSVRFTVRTSAAKADASNVRVCATMPRGLTVVGLPRGATRAGRVVCTTIPFIAAGKAVNLTINTRATASMGARALVAKATASNSVAKATPDRVQVKPNRPAKSPIRPRFTG
ncbi:MAG TPA: Ig-like domain-containing protein [Baekduia sp.]|nr:Ig-like domain-containing protein [Baekduia sp.]